jgi:DNA polymerase gamma 1
LVLVPNHGWCYTVDAGDASATKLIPFAGQHFCKIPHPGGRDDNVGSLLTRNFLKFFESGEMSTDCALIKRVLDVNSRFSFWTGYRERIREQFVVPIQTASAATDSNASPGLGLILPAVQPMGTVTRRAVEKTWMTASNAKEKLVGSELKAQVRAPPGFVFVGADVDSQELWIGSLLSDAQFGIAGATAIGWMTLQGSKADGSDLHSRTAAILGMTRDHAKVFNYGRIYGAGVKYAAQLLQRFNPSLAAAEAQARAQELYRATKGRRTSNRGDAFVVYAGGTESFMFNQMEAIARSPSSRTPVLGCEISEALRSAHVADNFLTSRVNWVVQSSGVDYLHLILVAAAFLFRAYGIAGRPALTIHDELRFLVREEDKWRAAVALQIANLWTRIAFSHALGLDELPLSVAFFSAVDMDHCLRKEVGMRCVTPSSLEPEPPGQSVNVYQALAECPDLGPLLPEWETRLSLHCKAKAKANAHEPGERQIASGRHGPGIHRAKEHQLGKHLALLKRQVGLPVASEPEPMPASLSHNPITPHNPTPHNPTPHNPTPHGPETPRNPAQIDDPSFEEQRKRWSSLISNVSKQQ